MGTEHEPALRGGNPDYHNQLEGAFKKSGVQGCATPDMGGDHPPAVVVVARGGSRILKKGGA